MTSRVSWNVMQCLDWVLCMRGCPSVSEKRGLPSPALPSGNWAEPPVPDGTATCKVPRLPPASRSMSVIWEGTQGPDAELGAFCTLSSTRQDDSTGHFWKSLRTGLSPRKSSGHSPWSTWRGPDCCPAGRRAHSPDVTM